MSDIITKILRSSSHTFIGHLGGDPKIQYFDSGKVVAKARLGVSQGRDQESDWFSLEVWGDDAQAFADQCSKGAKLLARGRARTNRWTTQQGEERTDIVVSVDHWERLDKPAPAPAAAPAPAPAAAPAPGIDEDEIPF